MLTHIFSDLQTNFEDVIAEPPGAHSADCVWQNAFKCFYTGKNLCYKILTYICAIPLAFCWGCEFACITFCHIWMVSPCYRVFSINLSCCAKFWSAIIHCYMDPMHESCALMFTQMFLNRVDGKAPYKTRTYESTRQFSEDVYEDVH